MTKPLPSTPGHGLPGSQPAGPAILGAIQPQVFPSHDASATAETETLPPAPAAHAPGTLPPVIPVDLYATVAPASSPGFAGTGLVPGYEILGELGRGGMGVVYKARQLGLDRLVALKMILAGGHAGSADRERFRTEAEAIARLQHPNIVQVHDVGEQDGKPFFSLEFCTGGSLDRKLDGTPWQPLEAAGLVQTLARAMQAAHEKNVIHRDLKPANVLMTESGQPKITDFGLARKTDEAGQTASGAIMGTPSYMAPEQAGGKTKELGPACDIYALGAILYELITGRPPFKAATALDTVLQVISDEPVPPRQLQSKTPRDLETICLKCLAKEPGRRYATAFALAEDLQRFQRGEPVQARPTGSMERGWRWCRRNPVVAGLAGVVFLVVVLGAGIGSGLAAWAMQEREKASIEQQLREKVEQLKAQAEKNEEDARHLQQHSEKQAFEQNARIISGNNLKTLWLAMNMHMNETNNHWISPAIYGKKGQPLLSWRVALLPYLFEETLYDEFRLDEPWDSEHNIRLLPKMPKVYTAPCAIHFDLDVLRRQGLTFLQVFVGPGAAFESGKQLAFPDDFKDGTPNIILIGEAGEPVPWTKPVDMAFNPNTPLPKLGGMFQQGTHVLMADCSIHLIRRTKSEPLIREFVMRNSGKDRSAPLD